MTPPTRLAEVAAQLDAARFVGRADTLELAAAAVAGTGQRRILYVHGPGGVGKSAVLRAVARQAEAAGLAVVHLDGRLVAPVPDGVTQAVAPASEPGSILLVDEVDELAPVRLELRRQIAELPADAVVVLAGRRPPDREWFDGALGPILAEVPLRPLSSGDARALLARHGLTDPDQVDPLVAWSAGYPLALTLGASLHDDAAGPRPGTGPLDRPAGSGEGLGDLILARLGGHELADVDPDVLDVACVAPAVDARLLAAALPGRPTRAGLTQLRALSVAERLGPRTTLHRLIRTALRARLRETDPDRYRTIVVRVADHLRARAIAEDPRLFLELADLVEDPGLRVGFGPSTTHYADRYREGDLAAAAEHTGADGTLWWQRLGRWCEEDPQHVVVVRRATGELAGIAVFINAGIVPAWAAESIEVGPVLDHARAAGHLGASAFLHDLLTFEDPDDPVANAEVIRIGNAGAMSLVTTLPRYLYVTSTARRDDDGTDVLGYAEVPELRRRDDERELLTIHTDLGPDGPIGQLHRIVLAEQQVEPPAATTGRGPSLVAALRSFHDDEAMAASTLGAGTGAARAASARDELRRAIDAAFADREPDRSLRQAIERTYLDPDGGHGRAQRDLHMSRSSFYRHLQRARQHLVDHA